MSRHFIISYDISSTKLRTALVKILQRHGCERLQKSVFLAPNMETDQLMVLKKELKLLLLGHPLHVNSDSLVCFPIKRTDISEMVWDGDTKELRRIMDELLFMLI